MTPVERLARADELLREGWAREAFDHAFECSRSDSLSSRLLRHVHGFPAHRLDHVGLALEKAMLHMVLYQAAALNLEERSFPSSIAALEHGVPSLIQHFRRDGGLVEVICPSPVRAVHVALSVRPEEARAAASCLVRAGFSPAPFTPDFCWSATGGVELMYLDGPTPAGRLRLELVCRSVGA